MDLEDFLVSNNILPLGSVIYLMFCTHKNGWGWNNFIQEANAGNGLKFPQFIRKYMTYISSFLSLRSRHKQVMKNVVPLHFLNYNSYME